jgi:hypothetical protein
MAREPLPSGRPLPSENVVLANTNFTDQTVNNLFPAFFMAKALIATIDTGEDFRKRYR